MSELTVALDAIQRGEPQAAEQLLPLVYEELRKLAAHRMAGEASSHTLQPTAPVHEAWLRLVRAEDQTFANRAHFFGAAAEAMRRILIDHARRKAARKHGGGLQRVDLEVIDLPAKADDEILLRVDECLQSLTCEDPGLGYRRFGRSGLRRCSHPTPPSGADRRERVPKQ
jgi:RNA polymerase sigma factor (TIGR02999 family)